MRRLPLIACACALGCSRVSAVDVDLPDDIRSAIVVFGDHGLGPFAWASGLSVPYDAATDREVALAGYRADLPELRMTLGPASACEPRIPPADVWLDVEGGQSAIRAGSERLLHAPWLDAACAGELRWETIEGDARCALAGQSECCLDLECGADALPLIFDPGAVDLGGLPAGCAADVGRPIGDRTPLLEVSCAPGGHFESAALWPRATLGPRAFEVTRYPLIDASRTGAISRDDPTVLETADGFLADLALFSSAGRRYAAVSMRGGFERACSPTSSLAIVERDRSAPARVVPAPPCTEALAPNPFGEGFLGGVPGPAIVRFDATGAQIDHWPLPGGAAFVVRHMLALSGRLVVVLEDGRATEVRVLTSSTVSTAAPLPLEFVPALVEVDARRFAILVSRPAKQIITMSLDLVLESTVDLEVGTGGSLPHSLSRHDPSGRFVVSDVRQPAAALHTVGARDLGPTRHYERVATPLATAPLGPHVLVALSSDEASPRARLALFDPAVRRFLPGSSELGFGAVSRMRADGDTVWAINTWSGELIAVR